MLKKMVATLAGITILTGCNPVSVFALANDITGTIVNSSLIVGGASLLANINNLTQMIQGLVVGG